ncbi:hypothetical protein MTO96_012827 [Rhipicephalus appendiculatus]
MRTCSTISARDISDELSTPPKEVRLRPCPLKELGYPFNASRRGVAAAESSHGIPQDRRSVAAHHSQRPSAPRNLIPPIPLHFPFLLVDLDRLAAGLSMAGSPGSSFRERWRRVKKLRSSFIGVHWLLIYALYRGCDGRRLYMLRHP